jgi:CDP-ribitol ribitolphosphotransferase
MPYFAQAFGYPKSALKVYPLPKTDLLVSKSYHKSIVHEIETVYPQLKDTQKEIIVYAPTFRKNKEDDHLREAIMKLIDAIDFERYELVIKLHPLTKMDIHDERVIFDHQFSSLQFFHEADVIITDYSAALFEACMLRKPIYFYDFDYASYTKNRSFYIDYKANMPGPIRENAESLMDCIERGSCKIKKVEDFVDLMVAPCKYSYTKDFTDFLYKELTHSSHDFTR